MLVGLIGLISLNANAEILRIGGSIDTSDPEAVYMNVVNGEASSVAKGSLMKPSASADDGVTALKTTDATDVPICVMAVTCSAGAVCRCQTYGFADFILADGQDNAISAGQKMTASAYDARVDGGTGHVVGVALDANSASGSLEGFIMLR